MKQLENALHAWHAFTQVLERVLIDNIAATTPWLAPLIPAYLVYHNMAGRLGFWHPLAMAGAVAVEFLGLGAVHTALEFWTYNDAKRQSDNAAPFWVALGAGLFYVVIVLTVNAVLDLVHTPAVDVLAKALLSLLSVDAALIIALRAQHRRRLAEIAAEKAGRKVERLQRLQIATQHNATAQRNGNKHDADFEPHYSVNPDISAAQLEALTGINRGTAHRWLQKRRVKGHIVGSMPETGQTVG